MEKYDVIIIGSGPAGLTGAIYATRANLSVLIIEAEVNGGKLSKTFKIENYPGIKEIGGLELAMQLTEHAQNFGAKLISGTVEAITQEDNLKKVVLTNKQEYLAPYVIVATGTKERTLDLPKADEFIGKGISYCAVCDGFFYRNKKVAIIGGGNSALEEALYLSTIVDKLYIIIRRDEFRAEASVVDKVKNNNKIEIIYKHLPDSLVIEDDKIKGLKIRNVENNDIETIECDGIFPYIGADPCTSFLDSSILDEYGYVVVNDDMSTAIEGIYAAGDCIHKNLRQVVTACNDGAIAANSIANKMK